MASVKNNGFFSEEFAVFRGVSKGYPVSAQLFILCMEVLSSYISQNVQIKGFIIDNDGTYTKGETYICSMLAMPHCSCTISST